MGIGMISIKKAINLYGIKSRALFISWQFIVGVLLTAGSGILLKFPLYYMELSEQYPLSIMTNFTIIVLGVTFLQEQLTIKRCIVIALIIVGILFLIVPTSIVMSLSTVIGLLIVFSILFIYKHSKSVSRYSVGHIEFGVLTGIVYVIICQFVLLSVSSFYDLGIYLSVACMGVFVAWEVLEHTIMKIHIYPRYMVEEWIETLPNSVVDIILGISGFYIIFILFYLTIADLFLSFIGLAIVYGCIPIIVRGLNYGLKIGWKYLVFFMVFYIPIGFGLWSAY
jgi:multidrug transporter EmrE-like cation transporter